MLDVLGNVTYRRLFAAQVIALLGTGLATVALALLAFDLAGERAGVVLGTALAIKMLAYVCISPVASALVAQQPRRRVLVAMDLIRAAAALCLPFVTEVWQVYALILVLQGCSAVFTPTFQATIPDILEDEDSYTRALSLSRLAYELENLLSPVLAALLLSLISFHWLFAGTALGFVASAALVLSVVLPPLVRRTREDGLGERTTRGLRIYLATPRLRGLLALNLSVAAAGAMVIVNTVVIVRGLLARPDADVGVALAAFGAGSVLAALALPRLLARLSDRSVMLAGAAALLVGLVLFGSLAAGLAPDRLWWALLAAWFALGLGNAAVLTPSGRLLRRSTTGADRASVFAAQFALSHACWLLTYPLAGWLGANMSAGGTLIVLAALTGAGMLAAALLWPEDDPEVLEHVHTDLEPGHPHLAGARPTRAGYRHAHAYVIDEHHRRWPG